MLSELARHAAGDVPDVLVCVVPEAVEGSLHVRALVGVRSEEVALSLCKRESDECTNEPTVRTGEPRNTRKRSKYLRNKGISCHRIKRVRQKEYGIYHGEASLETRGNQASSNNGILSSSSHQTSPQKTKQKKHHGMEGLT